MADDGTGTPGEVRIGISGWRYAPWRGTFYLLGCRGEMQDRAHCPN